MTALVRQVIVIYLALIVLQRRLGFLIRTGKVLSNNKPCIRHHIRTLCTNSDSLLHCPICAGFLYFVSRFSVSLFLYHFSTQCIIMKSGSLAVAMVQRRVMVVQGTRSYMPLLLPSTHVPLSFLKSVSHPHKQGELWVDVDTFTPFGDRVFLPSACPQARILSSDILAVFPSSDKANTSSDMLELQPKAFSEFLELSSRMQKKYEKMFSMWSVKMR